jgi:GNAT superfamily N-acetyltransferase
MNVLSIARTQLTIDLNCSPDDFDREGITFVEARENPGRRPFPREARHFEMYTMGTGVIVSASADLLPYLKTQLDGKRRDEAFDMPFIDGRGICFLPDKIESIPVPDVFNVTLLEGARIHSLYEGERFRNALGNDVNNPRPDVLAYVAKVDDAVVGVAGASADCEMMWQMGIDVIAEYRGRGLASALVARLAKEILRRGKVPYYGASVSNTASLRVACNVGMKPAWTCVYRGRFEGV